MPVLLRPAGFAVIFRVTHHRSCKLYSALESEGRTELIYTLFKAVNLRELNLCVRLLSNVGVNGTLYYADK